MQPALHLQVAAAHVQLPVEQAGVGRVADGDEEAGDGQRLAERAIAVTQPHTVHAGRIAQHLVHGMVPDDAHLALRDARKQPVLQDLLAAQLVAAVDQRDVRGDVRQVQRFLHRGVAAADHGHVLVAEEEAVAGGAGRHALALEGVFGGQAEIFRRGAGGDDQRIAAVAARIADQQERTPRELRGVDVVIDQARVEALRVPAQPFHQLWSLHAFGIAGPVVHVGGGHQLSALFEAGDQQRRTVGTRGIDGRAVAGRPGAEDEEGAVDRVGHVYFPRANSRAYCAGRHRNLQRGFMLRIQEKSPV
jgi:hypothetical protein